MFKNSFNLSFEPLTTDRRVVSTSSDYQFHIGSSVKVNSLQNLKAAYQSAAISGLGNRAINVSVFERVDVRKRFGKINNVRYPEGAVNVNYATMESRSIERLYLFYEEYAKEPLLKPSITYTNMKTFYPIQVIDQKFEVDNVIPKTINYLKNKEEMLKKLVLMLVFLLKLSDVAN